MAFPFSHKFSRLFQDSFVFGEATSSHFFRVTTSTQQLLSRNSYFFRTAALGAPLPEQSLFSQLFFQNSFFFRAKLLQSKHFLRIESYLGQLIFEIAIFFAEELLRKKRSTEELLFQSRYSAQHQRFQESYILEKGNNSKK